MTTQRAVPAAAAAWPRSVPREAPGAAEAETFAGRFADGMRALARAGVAVLPGERDGALREFGAAIAASELLGASPLLERLDEPVAARVSA